jgi:phosphoribosylanthranilate isomerase
MRLVCNRYYFYYLEFNLIVQVYEIQTEAEAAIVLSQGVDHIGSVILSETHWADSKIRSAIDLTHQAGKKSSLIPLFNNVTMIYRCIDYYRPDIIHLCDSIAMESLQTDAIDKLIDTQVKIRNFFPEIKIMRSIPIFEPGKGRADNVLVLTKRIEPYSDYFLADTIINTSGNKIGKKDQPVPGFVGITGRTSDWKIASELIAQSTIPVILAGGLGPTNVFDAIKKVRPFGVDSCTRTNALAADGKPIRFKKDPEKVRQFVSAARKAESF